MNLDQQVIKINVPPAEMSALEWVAQRYGSAEFLIGNLEPIEGIPGHDQIVMTPKDCAEYVQLLLNENNDPKQKIPTCLGGKIALRLMHGYTHIYYWADLYAQETTGKPLELVPESPYPPSEVYPSLRGELDPEDVTDAWRSGWQAGWKAANKGKENT